MRRRRPAPDQALFRFAWHDEADDRPDDLGDDLADDDQPPAPPPLRDRVLRLYAPVAMRELWGTPVVVRNALRKPAPSARRSLKSATDDPRFTHH